MSEKTKAYVAILAHSIITGFSFMLVKTAMRNGEGTVMLAHRFNFAVLVIVIFFMLKPKAVELRLRDLVRIFPYSLVFPVAFFLFQALGMRYISSTEGGIVMALAPVLTVVLASVMLREKTTTLQKFFLLLSVAGMILINAAMGIASHDKIFIGLFLSFIAVVAYSFNNVLVKVLLQRYEPLTITFATTIDACVVFNVMALIKHLSNGTMTEYIAPLSRPGFLFPVMYLGILSSLLTVWLLSVALKQLSAGTVGLFNNLPTVVSILAGVTIMSDDFLWYHLVGIVLILSGTIGFNLVRLQRERRASD